VKPNERKNQQILEALLSSKSVLITSHVRADGDSLGAMSALHTFLASKGIASRLCYDGEVPEIYKFLPAMDRLNADGPAPDMAVVLDCPGLDRIGSSREKIAPGLFVINIDHHPGNELFGRINLVDEDASSTAELLYFIFRRAECPITTEIARAIYTGILTDTGRFGNANTTREAFLISAELMEAGLDAEDIARRLYKSIPRNVFQLRSEATAGMRFALDGRVAFIAVSSELFNRTGTRPIDTQHFADIPRDVEGVDVGVFLREEAGRIKVSVRSTAALDANALARKFGGGGHRRAAGFALQCSLEEAEQIVLKEIAASLEPNGRRK